MDDVDPVLIRTRVPLHLAMRLGTRVNQLVSPFWADRSPVHRATTVALGVVDLAIARRLRSDPRLGLRLRLPLDAAELALAYATAVRDDYDEASVPAVMGGPLAVEAGARLGLKGLVVPAVNLTVGTLVRRALGQRPRTGTMAWQVAARQNRRNALRATEGRRSRAVSARGGAVVVVRSLVVGCGGPGVGSRVAGSTPPKPPQLDTTCPSHRTGRTLSPWHRFTAHDPPSAVWWPRCSPWRCRCCW